MEHPQPLHPCLDFGKYLSSIEPGVLSLWNCFSKIGFAGIKERVYLTELKKFLTSKQGNQVNHFNFEKNFYSFAVNTERDFDLFIDMIAENKSITILEIGNNYIPHNLIKKLVNILANKNLDELSIRMHWPGFKQSNHNLPFVTCLIKKLPYFATLEKLDLSGNHLNKECLIALADACEGSDLLLEVNLSDVTYVDILPKDVYPYWLRIHNAINRNQALLEAIINMPDDISKKQNLLSIAVSNDEQEPSTPTLGILYTFRLKNPNLEKNLTNAKSFAERLEYIEFDIDADNYFGVKAIELFYYDVIGTKVIKKIMEEPFALFYFYQGNTYHRNYDGNYLRKYILPKKMDPYTQRHFDVHYLAENPFLKKEINKLIEKLERDYYVKNSPRFI